MNSRNRWQCLACGRWYRTKRAGTLCPGAVCLRVTAEAFTAEATAVRMIDLVEARLARAG